MYQKMILTAIRTMRPVDLSQAIRCVMKEENINYFQNQCIRIIKSNNNNNYCPKLEL